MRKECSKCGRKRRISCFKKDFRYKKGIFCWCRDCESIYAKSPEVRKRARERWAKVMRDPKKRAAERIRGRNRWRNIESRRDIINARIKRQCGISLEKFEKEVKKQKSRCKLCRRKRRLCPDHNHRFKKYRGAICWPCNTMLGHIEASPGLLRRVDIYLSRRK